MKIWGSEMAEHMQNMTLFSRTAIRAIIVWRSTAWLTLVVATYFNDTKKLRNFNSHVDYKILGSHRPEEFFIALAIGLLQKSTTAYVVTFMEWVPSPAWDISHSGTLLIGTHKFMSSWWMLMSWHQTSAMTSATTMTEPIVSHEWYHFQKYLINNILFSRNWLQPLKKYFPEFGNHAPVSV